MKILIYGHSFAPIVGGVESNLLLLATGLVQAPQQGGQVGLRVTVVTPTPSGDWNDAVLPFQVVREPGFMTLLRLVRDTNVVHVAGPCLLPMLLAILFRKPFAVKHHGYQAICPNGLLLLEPTKTVCPGHFMARRYFKCLACNRPNEGWLGSLTKLLTTFPRRWASKRASCNIAVSHHVRKRHDLPRSKVIYHGVFDPSPPPIAINPISEPLAPSAVKTFAYVGRLVTEKGMVLLLPAIKLLVDQGYKLRLKFIGDGPERATLQQGVDALNLRECVTFTGYLGGEDLQSALADVGSLVMPSICEETAGLSAIEQMMRGRLVIAADIGGLGEIVGDAGLKFQVGDSEGLAMCMKSVLDKPGLVQVLGEKARNRALELFPLSRTVDNHVALYRELANPRETEGRAAVRRIS